MSLGVVFSTRQSILLVSAGVVSPEWESGGPFHRPFKRPAERSLLYGFTSGNRCDSFRNSRLPLWRCLSKQNEIGLTDEWNYWYGRSSTMANVTGLLMLLGIKIQFINRKWIWSMEWFLRHSFIRNQFICTSLNFK